MLGFLGTLSVNFEISDDWGLGSQYLGVWKGQENGKRRNKKQGEGNEKIKDNKSNHKIRGPGVQETLENGQCLRERRIT